MKIILIFLVITQAFCEDAATETSASGDGEKNISSVTMIDENEELLSSSINPSQLNSTLMDSEMDLSTSINTTLGDSTIAETTTTTTTVLVTETITKEDTTTTTLGMTLPTTITLPTTMTLPTTSTITSEKPTTKVQLSTSTSQPTTEKKKTQSDVPHAPTVGTTYVPEKEGKLCAFVDENLQCTEDIMCYGEGEIDCTEVEAASQTTLLERTSSSILSEDYPDYEDTIGTFPPNLVGVAAPKKRIPFVYNMGTTDISDSSTETVKEIAPIGANEITAETTMAVDGEKTQSIKNNVSNIAEVTTDQQITTMTISNSDGTGQHIEKIPSPSEISMERTTVDKEVSSSFAVTVPDDITTIVENSSETSGDFTTKLRPIYDFEFIIPSSYRSIYTNEKMFAIVADATGKKLKIIQEEIKNVSDYPMPPVEKRRRRKREDNNNILPGFEASSSSKNALFHMAAFESFKEKMQVKTCKISGNLRCSPSPSPTICRGKTYCQVVSGTAKMPETPTKSKGVENWAIIVIAICAIAAALTVSLLVFLVVTSWTKFKVQPQNDIQTLTYMNTPI